MKQQRHVKSELFAAKDLFDHCNTMHAWNGYCRQCCCWVQDAEVSCHRLAITFTERKFIFGFHVSAVFSLLRCFRTVRELCPTRALVPESKICTTRDMTEIRICNSATAQILIDDRKRVCACLRRTAHGVQRTRPKYHVRPIYMALFYTTHIHSSVAQISIRPQTIAPSFCWTNDRSTGRSSDKNAPRIWSFGHVNAFELCQIGLNYYYIHISVFSLTRKYVRSAQIIQSSLHKHETKS